MLVHLKMALHHILCNNCTVHQSVTYRYWEIFIFWWYRNRYRNKLVPEKVSEPISEKFATGKKSRNRYWKYLVPEMIFIAKILEFRRFVMGTGTIQVPVPRIFNFFWWYRNRYRKKSRNRYRSNLVLEKQVSELVLGKFGIGNSIGKIWYRKKRIGIV